MNVVGVSLIYASPVCETKEIFVQRGEFLLTFKQQN